MSEHRAIDCPQPVQRAVMEQGWYDLASIHWRYEAADVAAVLPDGLQVDTYDGSAWVGLGSTLVGQGRVSVQPDPP